MIQLETPVRARLVGWEGRRKQLEKALAYKDERAAFEAKRTADSIKRWESARTKVALTEKWGKDVYESRLNELKQKHTDLKAKIKKSLLFEDAQGLWTYSGLAYRLAQAGKEHVDVLYPLPSFRAIPWKNKPKHADRYYQIEAHDRLLAECRNGPCGVELATGAGKSTIIRNVIKSIGLRTLVMAPSVSIARQLYDDLLYHFGPAMVGLYGDGKKEYGKHIVVGIDDSLRLVDPDTEVGVALGERDVFIADESHLTPAESLAQVCFGLAENVAYRFFFSATQMRNDGLDIVLDAITGKIVLRKTVRELVDEGYLAKPVFKMVKVRTPSSYKSDDASRMTRKHLYYNPVVIRTAADLANKFFQHMKRPVMILVEELEQYKLLLPYLTFKSFFAHGPLTATTKKLVPEDQWKLKPKDLVEAFNRGEFPVLVGTSCIATGTDIQIAEACIYLMGGKSEIKLKQGVGRETRGGPKGVVFNPWTKNQKLDSIHVDFDVVDTEKDPEELAAFAPHRHAMARARMYDEIYGPVQTIDMLDKDL